MFKWNEVLGENPNQFWVTSVYTDRDDLFLAAFFFEYKGTA
jgi:hypothetical protein